MEMTYKKGALPLFYSLNSTANMILSSDFTRSGLQLGSKGVVEYPV